MTDKAIADHFGMPLRTYTRYKVADYGTWRKNIYYLMIEEMLRIEKRKAYEKHHNKLNK